MVSVGLTGGLASGKSTVARWLAEAGCRVIDADRLVAWLYRPGGLAATALNAHFGGAISTVDRGVDREQLSKLIFSDPQARKAVEALVHPLVRAQFAGVLAAVEHDTPIDPDMLRAVSPLTGPDESAGHTADESTPTNPFDRVVVLEATLLVEAGYAPDFSLVVSVEADPALRLTRAVARGMTNDDARARLAAQGDGQTRRRAANLIIDNSGDLGALRAQTNDLLDKLAAMVS